MASYRTPWQRLSDAATSVRYRVAIRALREAYRGFEPSDGYNLSRKLSDSQRRQIRNYYNAMVQALEGGLSTRLYPSDLPQSLRDSRSIAEVAKAAGVSKYHKRAKYLVIKSPTQNSPVKVSKDFSDDVVFSFPGHPIRKKPIFVNKIDLATNPDKVIDDIALRAEGSLILKIMTGEHELIGFHTPDPRIAVERMMMLQAKYDNSGEWLLGVNAYYSDTLNKLEVMNDLSKARAEYKAKIQKIRNKRKYQKRRGKM